MKKLISITILLCLLSVSLVYAEKCPDGEYWDGSSCESTTRSCNIFGEAGEGNIGSGEKTWDGQNHTVISIEHSGNNISDPILESDIAKKSVHPDKISFKYWESSKSHGHGLALVDNNGDKIAGVMTDNPEWDVYDANGFNTNIHKDVSANPNYEARYKVTINFDWNNDIFDVTWERVGSNNSYTKNGFDLGGDNVKSIQVVNYNNSSWSDDSLDSKIKEINIYPDGTKEDVLTLLDEYNGEGDYDDENVEFNNNDTRYKYNNIKNKGNAYYSTNMYSVVPTMTGNKVTSSRIYMGTNYDLEYDGIGNKSSTLHYTGDNKFNLKFYPPLYSFSQNIMDDKVFRFGQTFKIKNSVNYISENNDVNGGTNLTDSASFYKFDYSTIDPKYEECVAIKPLVNLSGVNDSIEEESLSKNYYAFDSYNNPEEVKGKVGENYLSIYSSESVWEDDGQDNINYIKNSLEYMGLTGSSYNYIKTYINDELGDASTDINFLIGGLLRWNIQKCSYIKKQKALNGNIGLNSFTYYKLTDKYGNPFTLKLKADDAEGVIGSGDKITNDDELIEKIQDDSNSEDSDSGSGNSINQSGYIFSTNPTSVLGLMGGNNKTTNIQDLDQRSSVSNKLITLNEEIDKIRKHITNVYRGSEEINKTTSDHKIDISDITSTTFINKTNYNGENYNYINYNNASENVINTVSFKSSTEYDGKKVVIVKGGDMYIKENLIKESNKNGLILVSLDDKYGNGGNIFIDPNVHNIEAFMISEGSVLSASDFDNNDKIEYDEIIDENNKDFDKVVDILKDQLYIRGSIHSRNTIGGANEEFNIPTPSKLIWDGINFNNVDLDSDGDKSDSDGPPESKKEFKDKIASKNYIKGKNIAKRFDLNFLRYYSAYNSGDQVLPAYTGSRVSGGCKYDFSSNDWSDCVNKSKEHYNKYNSLIIIKDDIYDKFSILK